MPIILDGTKGETFPSWTTGTRPATPNTGQTGYNTTLGGLETYNGSAWVTPSFGPAFAAYGSAFTSVSNGTYTKLAYNTKSSPGFDTNTNYDTTNYRFTPTVAGYYQLSATSSVAAAAAGSAWVMFYKNGSVAAYGPYQPLTSSSNLYFSFTVLLYANGSTDYFELYAYQSSGGALNMGSNSAQILFSAGLVRAG
jgi:hypothetical protein